MKEQSYQLNNYRIECLTKPKKSEPVARSIHECVSNGFDRKDFKYEDTLAHLESDYLLLVKKETKVVAFSSLIFDSPQNVFQNENLPNIQGTYFAAAVVSKEAQGQGIYQEMNTKRITVALERNDQVLFTRTQNPLVETTITHTLDKQRDEGEIASYSLERHYVPDCYGAMLSGNRPPRSPDLAIQKEHDKLRLEAGDAYILIYSIDYQKEKHET